MRGCLRSAYASPLTRQLLRTLSVRLQNLVSGRGTYDTVFGLTVLISFEKQYWYRPSRVEVNVYVPVGLRCWL